MEVVRGGIQQQVVGVVQWMVERCSSSVDVSGCGSSLLCSGEVCREGLVVGGGMAVRRAHVVAQKVYE